VFYFVVFFNVSIPYYRALSGRIMGERSTVKDTEERPIATMEALSPNLPGSADEKHESPQ
jgi:hypothetical protein